jgi:RNA polymerase sigma factor (sigma-70 family)
MTRAELDDARLRDCASAAAQGDRAAAQQLLESLQDPVYRLALRMLGHPADAQDATQEILMIVLTHVGSFRGESALFTWVFRLAASYLMKVKRGRRETLDFDTLRQRLDAGMQSEPDPIGRPDPEAEVLSLEIRLRCTEGMLLSLDRESRIAFILGEIFELPGEEAAQVLGVEPAAYRKRLSRARQLLLSFMRERCSIYDERNPCLCQRQVAPAIAAGRLQREDLPLARHPLRSEPKPQLQLPLSAAPERVERGAREVSQLIRVADVMRSHPDYASPEVVLHQLRELLATGRLELLRD